MKMKYELSAQEALAREQMKLRRGHSARTNVVTAFWQNVLLAGHVIFLAKKFRREIEMPSLGFAYQDKFDDWKKTLLEKNGSDAVRIDNFNSFAVAVIKLHPHQGILSDSAFLRLLINYYYFNGVHDEELEEERFSEFDVLVIEKNRPLSSEKVIEDGIYIKIGSRTSINYIKEYLHENCNLIKSAQGLFLKVTNIPTTKTSKPHENFKRDNLIMHLSRLTKKALGESGGSGNTKEEAIAVLMRKFGYNKGIMNSGVVKAVVQRRRKMFKAFYNE